MLLLVACHDTVKNEPKPALSITDSLQALIAKHPDSALLKEELIQYYREQGNYKEALSLVKATAEADSMNPRWHDIEAILHFENEDTLQSIRSFEKAISIYPSPEYLIPLGTMYAQTRNSKALVVADMLENSKIAMGNKEAHFIRGLYYSYLNEKKKAIAEFDKALAVSFTFMEAYREKAIALYDLGQYAKGLEVLDKAVTLQNNFDEGHYYRGRLLEKLGRKKEALEAYRTALMYDQDYIEAREAFERLNSTN